MKNRRRHAFWTLFFFAGAACAAEVPAVSGRLFSNVYVPFFNATDTQLQQTDTEAWITLTEKPNEHVTARATLVGQSNERPKDQLVSQNAQLFVREAYVRYRDSGFDFQAGRILLPWGKADAINPTDYFSAKNYQMANWDPEVQRIGPTAFVLSETPDSGASPLTFTGVLAPVFAQDKILVPPSLIPAGFVLNSAVSPRLTVGTMEAGGKVSYAGSGWDFSLSGFHGWNHFPDFSPSAISGLTVSTTPQFHRESAIGGDLSASFSDYVFRAEAAYHWTENANGTSPFVSPPFFDLVAGLEHPFSDRVRAQIQGIVHHVNHFHSIASLGVVSPLDQGIATANSVLQEYDFETMPGGTARLAYASEENVWEAEIFLLSYFPTRSTPSFAGESPGPEYYVRPRVSYELTAGLKATLGLDQYFGPSNRLFGSSRDYNAAFFEVLYVL